MQQILIHSFSSDRAEKLSQLITEHLPYKTHLSHNEISLMGMMTTRLIHLSVLDVKELTQYEFSLLQKIRFEGIRHSMLILGDKIDSNISQKVKREKSGLHYLERPFVDESILGLIKKLLFTKEIPHQRHRRYRTHQPVCVESILSGEILNSTIYNLSYGGAYCEFLGQRKIRKGDILRFRFNFDEAIVERSLDAKVMWTTHKGSYTGGYGAGVKFIKSDEIYRYLLQQT